MGYHIILKVTDEGLDSRYVEKLDDLRFFPELTEETIIYQGESHWTPMHLKDNETCARYAEANYRVGMKAQILFEEQSTRHGLIVEALSQTQESFRCYASNSDVPIKRGDYLIRNAGNLEVDVKCRSLKNADSMPFFFLACADVEKHANMESFTRCPVIIAFFEREGEQPVADSLRMITIGKILEERGKAIKAVSGEHGKVFMIPISLLHDGFTLIDVHRRKLRMP